MTNKEAEKIFKKWQNYIEVADKLFNISLIIPEYLLPYPKDIIREALRLKIDEYRKYGDEKGVKLIEEGAFLFLDAHEDDEKALESMNKYLNHVLSDERRKKETLELLKKKRDFWIESNKRKEQLFEDSGNE